MKTIKKDLTSTQRELVDMLTVQIANLHALEQQEAILQQRLDAAKAPFTEEKVPVLVKLGKLKAQLDEIEQRESAAPAVKFAEKVLTANSEAQDSQRDHIKTAAINTWEHGAVEDGAKTFAIDSLIMRLRTTLKATVTDPIALVCSVAEKLNSEVWGDVLRNVKVTVSAKDALTHHRGVQLDGLTFEEVTSASLSKQD